MSIEFSGMTIDGSDLQLLAIDALGSGYKTRIRSLIPPSRDANSRNDLPRPED